MCIPIFDILQNQQLREAGVDVWGIDALKDEEVLQTVVEERQFPRLGTFAG